MIDRYRYVDIHDVIIIYIALSHSSIASVCAHLKLLCYQYQKFGFFPVPSKTSSTNDLRQNSV